MKKVLLFLLLILMSQNICSAETITVPSGTIIPFSYDIEVSSKKVQPDDQIPITVVRDIIINNKVIFQKGAKGYLTVFDAKKVRTWHPTEYKKGGYIEIEDGMITDINGTMRPISYKDYQKGRDLQPVAITSNFGMANLTTNRGLNADYNEQDFGTINPNGWQMGGSNVIIQKGTRARAVIPQSFKIEIGDI